MPEYVCRAVLPKTLDAFTRAYLECAEWSGIDSEQEEAFELSVSPRWDDRSLAQAIEDCTAFQRDRDADIAGEYDRAGHDFWLTRNGHGTGFWDRGGLYPPGAGERLTDAAHVYGTVNVWYDEETETLSLS